MCCEITVGFNIFDTASSFSFDLFENPVSNCALFVNESAVKKKVKEDELLLTWTGSSLKMNFLMLGAEGRQSKDIFFQNLALHSIFLSSEPSLSFGFCLDLRSPLSFLHYMLKTVGGLNRQGCRSRCWSSSMEAVFTDNHYYIIVLHCKTCHFDRLASI